MNLLLIKVGTDTISSIGSKRSLNGADSLYDESTDRLVLKYYFKTNF